MTTRAENNLPVLPIWRRTAACRYRLGFVVLLLAFLEIQTGCSTVKSPTLPGTSPGVPIVTMPYSPDARQQLDIYQPANNLSKNPVIVFFYGGGWRVGKKSDYDFIGRTLAKQGFVTVIADYRLYPQVRFPGFVEDAALAVSWVAGHIEDYGGDLNRIIVLGDSTGAYLAAMLAVDPKFLETAGYDRNRLMGWIGIAGLYDPKLIQQAGLPDIFAGGNLDASFPIGSAQGIGPPALLIAGLGDDQSLPANTTEMANALRSTGTPVRVITYKDVGHIGIMLPFTPLFHGKDPSIVQDVISFAIGTGGPR